MQIQGINHIGIAAKDVEKAKWFFDEVLELKLLGVEPVAPQKTNTIMFDSANTPAPSLARLEILENIPGEDGPIKKFLEKKGAGLHHIALTVDNVSDAIAHMQNHNVEMIDTTPRPGAHQTQIAFVHPRSTGGFLVELVEEKK